MLNARIAKTFLRGVVLTAVAADGLAAAASDVAPGGLRCEYLTDPEGIDVPRPRLSWRLETEKPDARGVVQTAYQIRVASSLEKLAASTADFWDSGKVADRESLHHAYAGKALTSGRKVFWRVRVWDGNDVPSAWSSTAIWSMGLLDRSDWGGQWIGCPRAEEADKSDADPVSPPSPLLRRAFSVPGPIRRATLYVTARGMYECRLNGQRVGDHELAPEWTDYQKRIQYQTYVVPWRLYQNYGDIEVLRRHIDAAKRFIDGIKRDNPDLVWRNNVSLNYGDWLNGDTIIGEGYPKKGGAVDKDIFATAFFAYSTSLVARMCEVLGQEADAERYTALAEDIGAVFREHFVSGGSVVKGDTQAGYALALHFNLLPAETRAAAARRMVKAIDRYDDRISTGIHSTYRMMLELSRWGYGDLAYKLVESSRFPSWGYSIEQGATTIWERWDGYVKGRGFQHPGMNSFNHYAIGAVVEWIYRNVAGINPIDAYPGLAHIVIQPQPGGSLTWARCTYQSIRGEIHSAWTSTSEALCMEVRIPPNTTATVYVPTQDAGDVREGGRPPAESTGVSFIDMQEGAAVYWVGSGTYESRHQR